MAVPYATPKSRTRKPGAVVKYKQPPVNYYQTTAPNFNQLGMPVIPLGYDPKNYAGSPANQAQPANVHHPAKMVYTGQRVNTTLPDTIAGQQYRTAQRSNASDVGAAWGGLGGGGYVWKPLDDGAGTLGYGSGGGYGSGYGSGWRGGGGGGGGGSSGTSYTASAPRWLMDMVNWRI